MGSDAGSACSLSSCCTSSVAQCGFVSDGYLATSAALSASSRSVRRPQMISFAPASAKRHAMASPMPAVAPVMRTVQSATLCDLYSSDICAQVNCAELASGFADCVRAV